VLQRLLAGAANEGRRCCKDCSPELQTLLAGAANEGRPCYKSCSPELRTNDEVLQRLPSRASKVGRGCSCDDKEAGMPHMLRELSSPATKTNAAGAPPRGMVVFSATGGCCKERRRGRIFRRRRLLQGAAPRAKFPAPAAAARVPPWGASPTTATAEGFPADDGHLLQRLFFARVCPVSWKESTGKRT
jgi:hypothetical protein